MGEERVQADEWKGVNEFNFHFLAIDLGDTIDPTGRVKLSYRFS